MILSRHDWHCTTGAVRLALYDWLCTIGAVQLALYNWLCTIGSVQLALYNGHLAPVLSPEHHFTGLFGRNQFMYANCSNFQKQSLFPLPILSVISFSMLSTFPRLVFTSSIPQYSQISLKTANSYGFLALILFILPFRHIHRVGFRITSSHNLPFSSVLYWV